MISKKTNLFERNPKKIILLFVGIIIITMLLIVEFILSEKFHVQSDVSKRYIEIREILPNTNTIAKSDNPNKKFVIVRTDANGLLKPGKIHENADINMFFMGASTLLSLGLDEDKRIHYQSGRMLEKKENLKVNSYNAAYSSAPSFHGLNTLLNKIIPYSPDYLVFMYNAVDLSDLRLSKYHYWKDNYKVVNTFGIVNILTSIKNKYFPNIYYVLNTNLGLGLVFTKIIKFFDNGKNREVVKYKKTFNNLDFDMAKDMYTKNLKAIISLCKIYNITPVIMTEPYNSRELKSDKRMKQLGLKNFLKIHDEFNDIARTLGSGDDVILVDLDKHINNNDESLFVGIWHFSIKGVKKVSNLISDEIYNTKKIKVNK